MRREAQRPAAFARLKWFVGQEAFRPPASGVAATALPPQSKTSHHLPASSAYRGDTIY